MAPGTGGHTMPTPHFVSPANAAQARAQLEQAAHQPPRSQLPPDAAAMPPVVSAVVADGDATVPSGTARPTITFEDAAFGKSPNAAAPQPAAGPAPVTPRRAPSDEDRTVPFVSLKQVDGGGASLTIPAMFIANNPEEHAQDEHTRPDRPGGFSGGPTGEAPPDGVNVAQPSPAQIAQAQSSRVPTYPGLSPARLVLVARDGTEGESFPFSGESITVGRTHGDILFPEDPFLSPVHVRLNRAADGILLTDSGSTNGVYLRIGKVASVYPGDMFMIGHQLLRLDQLDSQAQEYPPGADGTRLFGTPLQPAWGRVTQLGRGGVAGDHMYLRGSRVSFGREGGDHVFPNDPFVSREHARLRLEITGQAMAVHLEDLGSANGTYVRIRGAAKIAGGDAFRVGDQILKLRLD